MRKFEKILVTGGAGFLGSAFCRLAAEHCKVVVLDALTYAGSLENLAGVEHKFYHQDVLSLPVLDACTYGVDAVFHFAAETHVDRSIADSGDFLETNVLGTRAVLEAALRRGAHVHLVSTDEVFGSSDDGRLFREGDAYDPSSPYSASKAASDHLARAYARTHGLSVTITNSCNCFGPRQMPEKFIPLAIVNALCGKPIPLYGDGLNVREWLHADDHARAVWKVATEGEGTYLVGSGERYANLRVASEIAYLTGGSVAKVPDRKGHDFCYAVDSSRLRALGWAPSHWLMDSLPDLVRWYRENGEWVDGAMERLGQ